MRAGSRGPQLIMPAKAGIHLGVHGKSDPKSGGQAPALRGHMRVSPTLQLCPGERSERLSQERPAVTRTCPINTSLCVNLPFDPSTSSGQAGSEPAPYLDTAYRHDTGANGIGKNPFVVHGSWFVVRGSWFVVRAARSPCRSTNRLSNRFMRQLLNRTTIHPVGRRSGGGRG